MSEQQDLRFLAAAIRLGERQLGLSWPNPAVGCIIVKDGVVVGLGATEAGGRPHAETIALAQAGPQAQLATVYVSLEPCNHHGKTPPCTEALMAAGVSRVVMAHGDPDPRVSGAGADRLQQAGIKVDFEPSSTLKQRAEKVHRGHFTRQCAGRPYVTLKLALSKDGGIGLPGKGQVAISSSQTNRLMHGLRSRVDAIGVGSGTWKADKPKLTVRLPGLEGRSPKRVLFGAADAPDDVMQFEGHDIGNNLAALADQGITTLLVEGGARLAQAFLAGDAVDELLLIQGQTVFGAGALLPFATNPFDDLEGAGLGGFQPIARRTIGEDRLMILQKES